MSALALTSLFLLKKSIVFFIHNSASAHTNLMLLNKIEMMYRKSSFGNSRLSDSFSTLIVVKAACHTGSTRKLLQAYMTAQESMIDFTIACQTVFLYHTKSIPCSCLILWFCIYLMEYGCQACDYITN